MKKRFFLFSITLISFSLISGYFIQNDSISNEEKPEKKECPITKGNTNNSCPFLNGKSGESKTECPYLNGEMKCPNSTEGSKNGQCPYLNKNENHRRTYHKAIKNIST